MIADALDGYAALGVSLCDALLPEALGVLASNANASMLVTLS